jgi:hypothetical protein
MHVFHTAGEPPSLGNTILVTIGCTRNRRPALKNRVAAYVGNSKRAGNPAEAIAMDLVFALIAPRSNGETAWAIRIEKR